MNNVRKNLFLPSLGKTSVNGSDKININENKSSLADIVSNITPEKVAYLESSLQTPSNSGFKAERAFLERLIAHKDTEKSLYNAQTMPRHTKRESLHT